MVAIVLALPCVVSAQVATDAQEQNRAREREAQIRRQQERDPKAPAAAPQTAAPELLPPAESPCFTISAMQLQVQGSENFDWLLDALTAHPDTPLSKCLGTQGIEIILKRARALLIDRGYPASWALTQPQNLSTGKLVVTILPGRIRAIRFAEPVSPRANAWNAVPAKPGEILRRDDLDQALENFKRVPTVEADIQIKPAEGEGLPPGLSDLVINYKQTFPFRVSLSLDDSGSKATGKYQGGVTFSHDNWWTLNDLFYVSLNRDLGGGLAGERGTKGGVVHYSVPFGYWLLGTTVSRSSYHQSVAGLSQDYVYSGSSDNAEIKLSRLVYRDPGRKTTVSLKGWQRKSNNFIDDFEVEVQRRVVGGWEFGIGHKEYLADTTLEANLAYKRGTGAFGSQPAPEEAFGEGTSRFALVTADATLNVPFKIAAQKLTYTGNWRWQYNRTPLTPQDRFSIAGRYTVRGFDGESSLSGERGWFIRNELSADVGDSGQKLYIGLDHGRVGGPSSEFLVGKNLTGMVLGVRGAVQALQYDLFIGRSLKKPEAFQTARLTAGVSLNYSF